MKILSNDIKLNVSEIFYSIQGEGTRAGLPCVFIRLQGCKLRCKWCDTPYALKFNGDSSKMTFSEIIESVKKFGCKFIQITGGEPLNQENVIPFMKLLCDKKLTVSLETSGAFDVSEVDKRVIKIMDIKCPASGMVKLNKFENINYINKKDEIKFVIADRKDFDWAMEIIKQYKLTKKTTNILFSPAFDIIEPVTLANWLLESNIKARLQLQIHKYIWEPNTRGV
ncbi:MAG: radical SAM protein [Bacteroidetes bacterium]|nr:MAG: radical SAM protein [Bacteroidota bacterium]